MCCSRGEGKMAVSSFLVVIRSTESKEGILDHAPHIFFYKEGSCLNGHTINTQKS